MVSSSTLIGQGLLFGTVKLSVSAGPVIPLGDFGNNAYLKEAGAGNADLGIGYTIEANLNSFPWVSFPLEFHRCWNPFNAEVPFEYFNSQNPGVRFSIETNSWKSELFLGGLGLKLPFKEESPLSMSLEGKIGWNFINSYHYDTRFTGQVTNTFPAYQESAKDVSFAWALGLDSNYMLYEDLFGITLKANYIESKHSFEDVFVWYSDSSEQNINFNQNVQFINILLGVELWF
jgi:hypothetical protein